MAAPRGTADRGWNRFRVDRADVLGQRTQLARRRRVGREVALGVAHDAGLRRDVEAHLVAAADDELGRAAADVDDERRRRVAGRALARRAAEGQPRLLVAADDARVEPVALGAHAREEVLAVGGVAHGAGEDGDASARRPPRR